MSQKIKQYAESQGVVLDYDELSTEPHFEYVGEIHELTQSEKQEREKQISEPVF